jgi:anti-sigma B factor antagonist
MALAVDTHFDDENGARAAVVTCRGELDITGAARLIEAFDRVGAERPSRVGVDLRGITFMDSTGLGCLTHGLLAFQKQGAQFEVLPSAPARYVIEKAGLTALLSEPAA